LVASVGTLPLPSSSSLLSRALRLLLSICSTQQEFRGQWPNRCTDDDDDDVMVVVVGDWKGMK
jgi:hypothetical protein